MNRRIPLIVALLFFIPHAGDAGDATPAPSLWVVPLDGDRTLEGAWDSGADVYGMTPEILVLREGFSAGLLQDAGFRVEGPFSAPEGEAIWMVRGRGPVSIPGLIDPARLEGGSVSKLVWSDGWNSIVSASGLLPEGEPYVDLEKRTLRSEPIRRPVLDGPPEHLRAPVTTFGPLIDQMVARADSAGFMEWIGNLAGNNGVLIGGVPDTILSRNTFHADCDTAERYVYEQFLAMGFTEVEFDTFTFNNTVARNVIATLPGTETPGNVVILCGHMDATNINGSLDAPGANDNASGTSVVLTAAEIMKDYGFRSTIKFCAWTGEEQGLKGSRNYAQAAAAAGENIIGVVNCDMVAWHDQLYQVNIGSVGSYSWLRNLWADASAEYTDLGTQITYSYSGSDHVSFIEQGYPAIEIIETEYGQYPCYHRSCDRTDLNDGNFGMKVTKASIATIGELAEPLVSTSVAEAAGDGDIPTRHALYPNTPNPFNPATTIRFTLDRRGDGNLSIYDVTGRLVRTLRRGTLGAGEHEAVWDGRAGNGAPAPSGTYFYRLVTDEGTATRKMLLVH
ncbi:MAG: M20/M25/M40 family metallo-hydrolase [Candidatus Eisenbacteria bacterium]